MLRGGRVLVMQVLAQGEVELRQMQCFIERRADAYSDVEFLHARFLQHFQRLRLNAGENHPDAVAMQAADGGLKVHQTRGIDRRDRFHVENHNLHAIANRVQ